MARAKKLKAVRSSGMIKEVYRIKLPEKERQQLKEKGEITIKVKLKKKLLPRKFRITKENVTPRGYVYIYKRSDSGRYVVYNYARDKERKARRRAIRVGRKVFPFTGD